MAAGRAPARHRPRRNGHVRRLQSQFGTVVRMVPPATGFALDSLRACDEVLAPILCECSSCGDEG